MEKRALVALVALLWATPALAGDGRAAEQAAHDRYVAAINSNDLDTLMADLTDDIVYQAPAAP
jgi:ketosteroid isomerase-like protein